MTKVIKEAWTDLSHEARELVLHGDNNQYLKTDSKLPIMNNLEKKYAKGKYDSTQAKKLWNYHADRCAMSYCNQFGGKDDKWNEMFNKNHRNQAASHWEGMHRDALKEGVDQEGNLIEENIYNNIFEAVLDKKPSVIKEEFDRIIKEKIIDIVNMKKEELAKTVFLTDEQIEESKKNKKHKKNSEEDDELEYKKNAKKKKSPRSNAIHASIHADDKTGME